MTEILRTFEIRLRCKCGETSAPVRETQRQEYGTYEATFTPDHDDWSDLWEQLEYDCRVLGWDISTQEYAVCPSCAEKD